MKRLFFIGLSALLVVGCTPGQKEATALYREKRTIVFSTSDDNLSKTFFWAKNMALSYSHDGTDSVGLWYEAALPQREAFCMRDVSHQCVGAHILGLKDHNKNMFKRFAENISEEKDWCTYWEINRFNKPAPADYVNDKEFWYNLNANFDITQACLKMYEWTADDTYLKDHVFTYFYDRSLDDYVRRWKLEPENVMSRSRYMNVPDDFDPNNNFHTCRGLASYVENFRGLTMSADLLAAMYAGFAAHSKISAANGDMKRSADDSAMAERYRQIIEDEWWDESKQHYNTFWTENKEFHRGEGVPFLLWFGATDNRERMRASVEDILSKEWNVENLSAFPTLLYRLGYDEEAYDYLVKLPTVNRNEYPEVSYGLVEGCVVGLMGIVPAAMTKTLSTCSHILTRDSVEVKDLPMWKGYVSVKHLGREYTSVKNESGRDFVWNVSFIGKYDNIVINGKLFPATHTEDCRGNIISTAKIEVKDDEFMEAFVK